MNGTFITNALGFGKNTALYLGTQASPASNKRNLNITVNMEDLWNDKDNRGNRIVVEPGYNDNGLCDTSLKRQIHCGTN
jgi:hypothetical protein